MTSAVDLAKLSEAVYEDKISVGKWMRSGLPFAVKGSGYKSALFQHMDTNDYAMAIAGTDGLDDLKSDAQLAMGNVPNQHRVARSAYAATSGVTGGKAVANIYITGHSLGGGLASMLAKEHGEPCVTFNAPGMARSFATLQKIEPGVSAVQDDERKVMHIRAKLDVVSVGTGRHMGQNPVKSVYTAPVGAKEVIAGAAATFVAGPAAGATVTGGLVALKAHGITRLISFLTGKAEYTKDLGWV